METGDQQDGFDSRYASLADIAWAIPKHAAAPSVSQRFKKRSEPASEVQGVLLYKCVDAGYFKQRGVVLYLHPIRIDGSVDFSINLLQRCLRINVREEDALN